MIGLVASVLLVLYQSSRPHLASLGRVPGIPGAYAALDRHPDSIAIPGILIFRLDAPIYYANALTVREQAKTLLEKTQPPPHAIILGSAGQDSLDITSADMLKGLLTELRDQGIDIYAAELHGTIREFIQRTGIMEIIGEDHIFPTIDAAVRYVEKSAGLDQNNSDA